MSKKKTKLLGQAATHDYRHDMFDRLYRVCRDLPPFTFSTIQAMQMDPTIRLGLAMRAAVVQSAEFGFEKNGEWVDGVQAENDTVAEFVLRQLNRIWQHNLDALLTAQVWGWAAAEVTFYLTPNGTVEVDRFLPRHAKDVLALLDADGEVGGVRFLRIKSAPEGYIDLARPKCLWHCFHSENGRHYGDSILLGCYSPWADKWLNGGALEVRRLFMTKDAYGGVDVAFPDREYILPSGQTIPSVDIARQIAEQLKSGGVTTRPAEFDDKGNELWRITRATIPNNPQHILQYPKDLDVEILRGLEIPDDVLTAESTGAWAGKQVPLLAFYQGLEKWLRALLSDCIQQIIEPLVLLNFGRDVWFEVTTKPLSVQSNEARRAV